MNLEALAASSLDGLMLGFVYGLAAMGLTLIFGIMKVIRSSLPSAPRSFSLSVVVSSSASAFWKTRPAV